ncbi:MAG TPA: 3D domain-containing protein [Candidatus Acidoferrum sp.]|nr:3D domain-containing protein [Candidatus Acidoferrum sp.]
MSWLLTAATITAYCHCARCCGEAHRAAANGHQPVAGLTVAGPRWIPLGTHVYIEGIGERVVTDRLARIYDDRFDVFVATHEEARRFGRQRHNVRLGVTSNIQRKDLRTPARH